MKRLKLFSILLLFSLISCRQEKPKVILDDTYKAELTEYTIEKDNSRKKGYLQLCGLFIMKDSINSFGKDGTNTLSLKIEGLPPIIGSFTFDEDKVTFTSAESVEVTTSSDSLVTSITSVLGPSGSDVQLFHDRLKFQVITRSGQHYLRVWDKENPAIEAFKGFEWFALNPNMIFDGNFEYYVEPKETKVKSKLGVKANTKFVGRIRFDRQGESHYLEVGQNGFTMVADATNGETTYGGGRYVYLDLPEKDSIVKIDFNKLYNPPCSFSEFTTCLYPPLQNMLPFNIEAGETISAKN